MAVELNIQTNRHHGTMDIAGKNGATMSSSGYVINLQEKIAVPCDVEQIIVGDVGYYLSKVTVQAVPSTYGRIGYNGGVLTVW